jgi:D-alanine--poly(phosphoribitol) ligase subunit 2
MREKIIDIINSSVKELDSEVLAGMDLSAGENLPLYGKEGNLDSIALVNLIVGVETRIEEDFGKYITIADERAMSQESSPFKTVGSLADYIAGLLEEN